MITNMTPIHLIVKLFVAELVTSLGFNSGFTKYKHIQKFVRNLSLLLIDKPPFMVDTNQLNTENSSKSWIYKDNIYDGCTPSFYMIQCH